MTFFLQQLQNVYTIPLISAMLSSVNCLNLLVWTLAWQIEVSITINIHPLEQEIVILIVLQ